MSSAYEEPQAREASSPAQQASAGRPSRPNPLGRHSSSWMNRLHRRHDRKHHPRDLDVEEPLLSQQEADDEDSDSPVGPQSSAEPRSRFHRLFFSAVSRSQRAYQASRQSLAGKAKVLLVASLLAVLLLLIWIGAHFPARDGDHHKPALCLSAACVHAASGILYNLDPDRAKLDACSQFDQMVCGGWQQRHDLRTDQDYMFTGTVMAEHSQTVLHHILTQDASALLSSSADEENFRKIKDDYEACMDEKFLRDIGSKPLMRVIDQIKEFFPTTVDRTGQSAFPKLEVTLQKGVRFDGANQLTETLLFLINLDITAFLKFGVQADDRDPDTQVIMISPPRNIGLPSKEYYDNEELVSEYRAMSAKVLEGFIAKPLGSISLPDYRWNTMPLNKRLYSLAPQLNIGDLANEIVDLEVKLAAATPLTQDSEDVTQYYNPMSVPEVHALLPQVSLDYLVSQLAPKDYSAEKIIVGSPPYLSALSTLLTSTRKETLQAFFIWKSIQQYESQVEDSSLKPLRAFNNRLRGLEPSAEPERWRKCVNAVDRDLGWILSKFFVENAFSEESKEFGDQIVTDIKDSFVTILGDTKWMSKDVRDRAIGKVHAIDQKIGFPTSNPDVLDPEALSNYYNNVTISNSTFFENKVQAAQSKAQKSWRKLGEPTRHDEWDITVPTVNAYYSPSGNEIVFPAAILQTPIFHEPGVPQYLTYGAFGAVAGHELSHAFDSTGSHYDETGNYTDWFDQSTEAAFEERATCFKNQYSQFTVPNLNGELLHVNGKLTLGENIADAGGVHAAYSAWKKREKAGQTDMALPGLQDFTPDQLFFISYASCWCAKSTAARAAELISTDPHAPMLTRILGTMDNSKAFKEAFQCPNVEPTCKLW